MSKEQTIVSVGTSPQQSRQTVGAIPPRRASTKKPSIDETSSSKRLGGKRIIFLQGIAEVGRAEWSSPPSLAVFENKILLKKRRRPRKRPEKEPGDQASFPGMDNQESAGISDT